ncbi:MAG TPA: DNA primase [Candidatus Paceibacterota bacterium]|nr:DNA primase [Verrucomicrobiota bacterium]HSA09025.1 DNA primase [Candidatus Paceibacterota bacterium]
MAGLFSSATLEQIRAASDIVDVIGSYLPLKRAGANFVALCPFHKEKTPSFNVNPHRQIFHCFGCHKGGDVFAFVKEYENIDFPEAVRRLADRAKIPLEYEKNAGEQHSRHLKDRLLEVHEQIAQRWQNALANEASGHLARDYLAKRGVSEEAVKLFRLGAAPDLWDDTVNWARSKGHELALVEQAGLILRRQEGDGYYDRFRGRLMFPICDEQGRVIGFSGRVLAGDEKTAKYVNSPETPIFTKSKVFFGLDKSKRAVLEAGHAIVCEGQLDLIACFMAGVQNVVAPQGTAFTADHARILRRYVEEVVLCFDSDEAGQNAAVRSLDSLLASGLAVRVAVVPAPHDPDSFIKASGGPAFKQLVERAEGFFDYYLNRLTALNQVTTDKGRLAVLRGMAEAVHKTGNAVLIDKYAQKTALRLGVTPDAVRAEFGKQSRPKTPAPELAEAPAEEPAGPRRPAQTEFWLLKLLLLHDDLADWAAAHLDPAWVQHPLARQIIARRLAAQANQTWTSLAAFVDECDTPEMRSLVTEATTESRPIPNPAQQLRDVAQRLRNQALDRQLAALMQRAHQPETSEAARNDLLRQQQELRQLKRQPIQG